MEMTYWTVEPPAKWQAGLAGAARTPFFFSCADCGGKDAEIAAIISTDGTWSGIGLLPPVGGGMIGHRPAMFCRDCYARRMSAPQGGSDGQGR